MDPLKSNNVKALLFLVIIALLVRFAILGIAVRDPARVLTPDSSSYLEPASNLIEYGSFSVLKNGTLSPYLHRTPGYSGFLAFIKLIFGGSPVIPALVFQNLIAVFSVIITYKLTALIGSNSSAFVAGLFMALSPISIIYSNYILTETLFAAVLLGGIYFLIKYTKVKNISSLIIASSFLAFTVYIRPISLYLVIPVAIGVGMAHRSNFRLSFKHVTIFFLIFCVIVAPWFVRNFIHTDKITFSTIQSKNLLFYRAAGVRAELVNKDFKSEAVVDYLHNKVKKHFESGMSEVEKKVVQRNVGLKIILTHPLTYVKVAVKGAFKTLAGPGRGSLARLLGYGTIQDSHFELNEYNITMRIIIFLEIFYLLVLYLLACLGFIYLVSSQKWVLTIELLLVLFYFIGISSGPESYSRFRVPIEPIFAIFAGIGYSHYLGERWSKLWDLVIP